MNNFSFERWLYKTYILFLPMGQLIELPFGDYVNSIITQLSTWLMLIGVMILFFQKRFYIFRKIAIFSKFYLFMAIYSLFAAFILTTAIETTYQESPLRAIMGDIVLYFVVLLSIYYNCYHLTHTVRFNQLYKIFEIQIVLLLTIGYIQLGVLFGIGPLVSIYAFLTSFLSLAESSWLSDLDRGVCFFGSEPSSATLLCLFIIPLILASIYFKKGRGKFKYIIYLMLFSFLFLLSNSSFLLVSFVVIILCFLSVLLFSKIKKLLFYTAFFSGLLIAMLYAHDFTINSDFSDSRDFTYVIYGKMVDKENMSTAMRVSTVINDMKIFYDYPLTGVGNGNQGYFYDQNIPSWVRDSGEVQTIIEGNGVANGGGNFFPAYISAFGLIGIFVLLRFLRNYKKAYGLSFLRNDKQADMTFKLGIILFLFVSWIGLGIKQNETLVFLLTLPLNDYSLPKKYLR